MSRLAVLAAGAATFAVGFLYGHQSIPPVPAVIGADPVPLGLHCQEDEAIALNGTPVPVCVNVAELAP